MCVSAETIDTLYVCVLQCGGGGHSRERCGPCDRNVEPRQVLITSSVNLAAHSQLQQRQVRRASTTAALLHVQP